MAKTKKYKFVPKKKRTIIGEPNWVKLSKSKTEEDRQNAFVECDNFVHNEITDKEYLQSMKKWIRVESGWDVDEQLNILPDVYLVSFSKHGWKAIKLGFMPEAIENTLKKFLIPLFDRSEELRIKMYTDPAIHPSLLELDKDDNFHPNKVKEWIKYWQNYLRSSKQNVESSDSKLRLDYQIAKNYVSNMTSYLRTSIWLDHRWGKQREFQISQISRSLAYDNEGIVKRTQGVYYPDIGEIWQKK